MKSPVSHYPAIDILYPGMLDKLKDVAKSAKIKLLSFKADHTKLSTKNGEMTMHDAELYVAIYDYFKNALFFEDEEAINKLKELGLGTDLLQWFVSLPKLNTELEIIRTKNINIDSIEAFTHMRNYLISKFAAALFFHFKSVNHDNVRMSPLSKEIISLKAKRRIYGKNLERYKYSFSTELNNLINGTSKIVKPNENNSVPTDIDILHKFSRGKTESFHLKFLLEDSFDYDSHTIKKSHFFSIMYDLLSLLVVDKNFISEDDFFNSKKRYYLAYKSYEYYKAKKIRTLIYPTRKK